MDNFFYNLNKKMADLAQRQDLAESAVTERDMGKHNNATTGFKALAKKAGAKYGSKAAGERVAGAQFQKMKKAGQLEEGHCPSCDCSPCKCKSMEESAFQAAIGKKKYGDAGMKALQKAGRNHASNTTMSNIRNRYDKYDEADNMSLEKADMAEGMAESNSSIRDDLAYEIELILDGAVAGNDQTDSIADELGDAFDDIQASGDKTAMMAYEMMVDTIDTNARTQANAARKALKLLKNPAVAEGAFKNVDATMQQPRHRVGRGELNQVPGVQNIKPRTKENPLKNVAKGIKAFVKGEPEPMDEVKSKKSAKPDYIDLDRDGNRKESMKKASSDNKRSTGTAFDPDTHKRMKTDQEGTGNFDKKKISTGTVYTRRHKEDDEDEIKSDQPKTKGRPKGPAKGPERVTAKAWKHKGGRAVKENEIGIMNRGEYDQEGDEVKGDMHTVIRHAQELEKHLQNGENLPTWVIEKVGQIKGMMTSISDYMLSQHERGAEQSTGQEGIRIAEDVTVSTGAIQELWKLATFLKGYIRDPEGMAAWQEMAQLIKGYKDSQQQNVAERSKSQTQARMMAGAAHNPKFAKKVGVATKVAKEFNKADTGKDISRLPKKVKKTDEGNDGNLANNAKPYDKVTRGDVVAGRLGKDEMGGKKPKEKKVAETTTSGSVASAPAKVATNAGGMSFGKGVYEGAISESYEKKLSKVLSEGMNVTVTMNSQPDGGPSKTINVTADGEDAEKLAEILKLAGLGGQSGGCSSCGQSSCGCETVDEAYGDATATKNNPDWPTDTETTDANDPYLRRFSGGLNGAKSTGQTTVPVIAGQRQRTSTMEENVELERSLFNTWKTYKGQ